MGECLSIWQQRLHIYSSKLFFHYREHCYIFFLLQPNTFQVVVASQGSISYAIFTYKCDLLRWTNYNAGVGYSAGPNFFEEHTLSRNESVTDIDCLNYPSSVWYNLVYKLNGGDKI